MKFNVPIILIIGLLMLAAEAKCETIDDDFSSYRVNIYSGNIKVPEYYKKTDDGWRDDMGKLVDNPHVNFAGKYFIGRHSCGTECVYYSLSDLTTGKDSNYLDMFSSGGDTPTRTRDGRRYLAELRSKPGSRLLVARYHISASANRSAECKEKEFLLDESSDKIVPAPKDSKQCEN
jgi:hypothetical protein